MIPAPTWHYCRQTVVCVTNTFPFEYCYHVSSTDAGLFLVHNKACVVRGPWYTGQTRCAYCVESDTASKLQTLSNLARQCYQRLQSSANQQTCIPPEQACHTSCCLQAANEALLKLLQVPKAVPQHAAPQHVIPQQNQHYQHQQQLQQLQQQQQQARTLQPTPAQPASNLTSQAAPQQHAQALSAAGSGLQLPFGALQLQQQQQQQQGNLMQQQQQQQQRAPQLQQVQQQQPQATQTWQQARPGSVTASPGLPTGVSFLPAPPPHLAPQPALASLAVQISAANLAGASQPLLSAAGGTTMDGRSGVGGPQLPVVSLPASMVLSGVPVGMSQPVVSASIPSASDDRGEA